MNPAQDFQLLPPNVIRDAPFSVRWLSDENGKNTLLAMGNLENEISAPTLEGEQSRTQNFIDLGKQKKQITRIIFVERIPVGAVWIDLTTHDNLRAPSVHIMIGNLEFRGKGLGHAVLQSMLNYFRETSHTKTIFSRHLTNNFASEKMLFALGFVNDGEIYTDKDGLVWQNVKLNFK